MNRNIDQTKLDLAITYIERMAEGKHPVTNQDLVGDTVVNDPNVIRCLFFIQDTLQKVQENGGVITSSTRAKKEEFPFETLKDFKFRKDNSITHIMQQINEPIEGKNVKYTAAHEHLFVQVGIAHAHAQMVGRNLLTSSQRNAAKRINQNLLVFLKILPALVRDFGIARQRLQQQPS